MKLFASSLILTLSLALVCLTIAVRPAVAQTRPDPATPATPTEQPAQPTEAAQNETSPERKWPPFGIAIGGGVREIVPAGDATTALTSFTPVARFIRHDYRAGLVPSIRLGLGKQRTTLVETTATGQTEMGSLYLHPFTFGLGWSQPVAHKVSMVFSASAGYSWNGVDSTDNGRGHPQLLLPAGGAGVVDVSNSFAWEVSGRAWYDINPRVSILLGASYLGTHPELTLADGSTRRWDANQVRLDFGVAFTVLKPKLRRRP